MSLKNFALAPKTLTLTFEGTEYEGLEVECQRSASLATFLELQQFASSITEGSGLGEMAAMTRQFGDGILLGWNLARGEEALPANGEGLLALPDVALVILIINKWLEAVSRPAPPLGIGSSDGALSVVG